MDHEVRELSQAEASAILKEQCIVVTTASSKEFDTVSTAISPLRNLEYLIVVAAKNGKHYVGAIDDCPVIVVKTNEQGSLRPSAIINALHEVNKNYNVMCVVSVGICFSMSCEKLNVGDLIMSSSVWQYETAKIENGKTKILSKPVSDKFSEKAILRFLENTKVKSKILFGQMVSGEKLVNEKDFLEQIKELFPEAVAGDMEGAGVSSACKSLRISWFIIKSISDFGSGDKSDKPRAYEDLASRAVGLLLEFIGSESFREAYKVPESIDYYERVTSLNGKIVTPFHDLKLETVVMWQLPKARKKTESVTDNRDRIHYEYSCVTHRSANDTGYLLFGYDIAIRKSVNHFVGNQTMPSEYLYCLTPNIVSESSGKKNYRAKEIEKAFRSIYKLKSPKIDYLFLENHIWNLTFGIDSKGLPGKLINTPYFVDQPLYKIQNGVDEDFSKGIGEVFTVMTSRDKREFPVFVLVGEAGVGKSTFSRKLVNEINIKSDISALYLANDTYVWPVPDRPIESIEDFYGYFTTKILDDPNALDVESFILNLYCGNLILVVDGIDEIHSALGSYFSVEKFMSSIVELNKSFNSCCIMVTCRDYYKDIVSKLDGVELCCLRGFSQEIAYQYFEKRFSRSSPERLNGYKSEAIEILRRFSPDGPWNPLLADLASEIVSRPKSEDTYQLDDSSKYLDLSSKVDQLIAELLAREESKQNLNASCDELLDLLMNVCIDHRGSISVEDMKVLIQDLFFEQVGADPGVVEKFLKSPFFYVDNNTVQFKYKYVNDVLRARSLVYLINSGTYESIRLIDICRGLSLKAGETLTLAKKHKVADSQQGVKILSRVYSYFVRQIDDGNVNLMDMRRSIAGLLLFVIESSSVSTKKDRSDLLVKVCSTPAKYFTVFNGFYAIDFTSFSVLNGLISDSEEIFHSTFPDKVCLFNTKIDFSYRSKVKIPPHALDVDCECSSFAKESLEMYAATSGKKRNNLTGDLRLLFGVFVASGSFLEKSRNGISRKVSSLKSSLSIDALLDHLCRAGWLLKRYEKGVSLYSVESGRQWDVMRLVSENSPTNEIKKLLIEIDIR